MFDLIISDIEMPEMNGFAFAREVKGSGAWQQTPIIALSARVSDEDQAKGLEAGFDEYVPKLHRDVLIDAVKLQMNKKSLSKE